MYMVLHTYIHNGVEVKVLRRVGLTIIGNLLSSTVLYHRHVTDCPKLQSETNVGKLLGSLIV